MKKLIVIFLFIPAIAWAADTKTTALPENASPATTGLLYYIDDPSGTPVSQKTTLGNLLGGNVTNLRSGSGSIDMSGNDVTLPGLDGQIQETDLDASSPSDGQIMTYNAAGTNFTWEGFPVLIGAAVSDETTDLTTGTAKITFRAPFGFTLSEVRANVNSAPTGAALSVDINESGSTILSTKLFIDISEETSESAATPAVISDSAIADDSEITIDIDQVGSASPGKGLKVWFNGTRTL